MEITSQEHLTAKNNLHITEIKKTIFEPLENQQLRSFKLAAFLLYLLAYLYANALIQFQTAYFFPITIGLITLLEFLARKMANPFHQMDKIGGNRLESSIFLATTLIQSLALSIWDFHYQLEVFQFLAIHASFVFYVLSRTGWLTQGRLGIMVWFDITQAFFLLPFKNFLSVIHVFLQKYKFPASDKQEEQQSKQIQQVILLLVSILVACFLVFFVWSQLSQVSENFASLTNGFGNQIQLFFNQVFASVNAPMLFTKLWFAFPVSLYLYGLIAGSLLAKKDNGFSYQVFHKNIQQLQVFPAFTAYIILGSLCLTYALFFLTGLTELGNLLNTGSLAISPQDASSVAVAGFWQLVRVSLLNFAVLGVFYLISKKPLWDQKGTRRATTLLFIFASLLALLAGWKLFAIYIYLYGPTPLRLLSGWFVLVLFVWCLLTLVRLYKPIQAIRIGIFYALISFTLLCYLYPIFLFG